MTKYQLFTKLKSKGIFWSYSKDIKLKDLGDKTFIEYVLKYADFDDIILIFKFYDRDFIKAVWQDRLIGDKRFIKLNLMLARVFFDMDVESSYFKGLESARDKKLRVFTSQN
jgi:hypothetical protein